MPSPPHPPLSYLSGGFVSRQGGDIKQEGLRNHPSHVVMDQGAFLCSVCCLSLLALHLICCEMLSLSWVFYPNMCKAKGKKVWWGNLNDDACWMALLKCLCFLICRINAWLHPVTGDCRAVGFNFCELEIPHVCENTARRERKNRKVRHEERQPKFYVTVSYLLHSRQHFRLSIILTESAILPALPGAW